MIIAWEGGSVLLIDLPLAVLGQSSRMAILELLNSKKSTPRAINRQHSLYVEVASTVCVCVKPFQISGAPK